MGKATNPRKPGTPGVSTGGRKPKEGERYPSGKLKRPGPNQLMVERRKALCADVTMASCPLDAAFSNGWLSPAEYAAGQAYIAIRARAQLGAPGIPSQADHSRPDPVGDIRRVSWSELSHDEIARIWDSAMRDIGTVGQAQRMEESAAKAMIQYKAVNAAMSPFERMEVDLVCIQENWPQWIVERVAGNMTSPAERKRTLLVNGLAAVRRAIAKPRDEPAGPDTAKPKTPRATRAVHREVYVDEHGQPLLEVERVSRG